MRGIFPTLLAFGVGLFVFILIWKLLTKGAKTRLKLIGTDEIDRTASELIEKHGDGAGSAVAKLAEECLAVGDFDGEVVWKRVAKAVAKLQADG